MIYTTDNIYGADKSVNAQSRRICKKKQKIIYFLIVREQENVIPGCMITGEGAGTAAALTLKNGVFLKQGEYPVGDHLPI